MTHIFYYIHATIDTIMTSFTTNSATVTWRIPSFTKPEVYYILYGTDPDNLDLRTDLIPSVEDPTATNETYELTLTELDQGTVYYLRVAAVFDILFKRESEVAVFRTLEERKQTEFISTLLHSQPTLFSHHRTRVLFRVLGAQ